MKPAAPEPLQRPVSACFPALRRIASEDGAGWPRDFAQTILAQARWPGWHPSPAQLEVMRALADMVDCVAAGESIFGEESPQ